MKSSAGKGVIVLFFLVLICVFLPSQAFGADFFVAYAEGDVTVMQGSAWTTVNIGDTLTERDTVKLAESAFVELSTGNDVITLTSPGTYPLRKMVNESAQREKVGFGSLLASKLDTAFSGTKHKEQSVAGGVRGSEAVEKESLTWMDSDSMALIDSGKEELARGDMDTALGLFQEAYDYALDSEEEALAVFYLAGCYDLQGKKDKAVSVLRDVGMSPGEEIYPDFNILKGKLLVETFAYVDAETELAGFDFSRADEETSQIIYLLLGIACLGQEKNAAARNYLTKAKNLNAGSDTGKAAAELMRSL